MLGVSDRGVATSSVLRRRWRLGDGEAHHLIDPRSRRPCESDAVAVTVVAASATMADFHAKVALILGPGEGLEYLEREEDVEGLIVTRHRGVLRTYGLRAYEMAA
jgi:thiamine biosynthesis lipoprotein